LTLALLQMQGALFRVTIAACATGQPLRSRRGRQRAPQAALTLLAGLGGARRSGRARAQALGPWRTRPRDERPDWRAPAGAKWRTVPCPAQSGRIREREAIRAALLLCVAGAAAQAR